MAVTNTGIVERVITGVNESDLWLDTEATSVVSNTGIVERSIVGVNDSDIPIWKGSESEGSVSNIGIVERGVTGVNESDPMFPSNTISNIINLADNLLVALFNAFKTRVLADGGVVDNEVGLDIESFDDSTNLTMLPNAYKDGVLYTIIPEDTSGDFSVVRGSGATRVNSGGLVETVSSNAPRIDYSDGTPVLLTEPQSTNLIVNSELNNVESIVVSAVSHTISFYGTGSITLSGTHTATLVGTGANDRVSLTFTPTAGTLICTDSGSVDNKQVEALSYSTSYIPTSGAIATRLADSVTGAGDATTINDSEGVLYFEGSVLTNDSGSRFISLSDGSTSNRVALLYYNADDRIRAIISSGGTKFVDVNVAASVTDNHKVAIKYKANDFALWVNGVEAATDTTLNAPIGLDTLDFDLGGSSPFYGKTKGLRVYNTALTDLELQELTTI